MAKKKFVKAAPKTKAAPKAAQPPAKTEKSQTSPQGEASKAKTPKLPKWLKSSPTQYIVGTEDYAAIIQDHNDKFDTMWNKFRVKPQVFYTIHEAIWKYYHDKK